MGGRGSFVKEKGIIKFRYEVVGFIDGVKILEPRNKSEKHSLPERANTPCTSYVSYNDDGIFNHFITFDKDRMPIYAIDYGVHRGKKSLHVHYYKDGDRSKEIEYLNPGDELYEKHKKLFKGVKIWKAMNFLKELD